MGTSAVILAAVIYYCPIRRLNISSGGQEGEGESSLETGRN